jgi:hypothetical protein
MVAYFGADMHFLCRSRNITQTVANGNMFAAWLEPLAKVMSGDAPPSSLDGWSAWASV